MPKVTIIFDRIKRRYFLELFDSVGKDNDEWEVVMDMKASHFRNMRRNEDRFQRDQEALKKFFIEAQMSGKEIRER